MERWPRRRKHDGEATGRGEERCAPRVPSGIKLQGLVYWVRKVEAELRHCFTEAGLR